LPALVKFSHQLPALVKFPHDCLLACVICQRLSNRHSATCQPLPTCHMVACQPVSFTSACQILIKLLARPFGPYNKAFGFFIKPRRRLNRVICCDFQVSNQFLEKKALDFSLANPKSTVSNPLLALFKILSLLPRSIIRMKLGIIDDKLISGLLVQSHIH